MGSFQSRLCRIVIACALSAAGAGCGASGDDASSLGQAGISRGSYGPEVLELRQYLAGIGYFPNGQLQSRFPSWHPFFPETTGDPADFDSGLQTALKAYQTNAGLAQTGSLDAATAQAMIAPRCGNPDRSPSGAKREDKWALEAPRWSKTNITFAFASPNTGLGPLSAAQTQQAIAAGIQTWQGSTQLTFSQVSSTSSADYVISYGPLSDPGKTTNTGVAIAQTGFTGSSATTTFNTFSRPWSIAALAFIAAHESGHAIGLDHSSDLASIGGTAVTTPPLMYPFNTCAFDASSCANQIDDDKIAANIMYNDWDLLPGLAIDIGVGQNGTVWILGTDGIPYVWAGANWVKSSFGGRAIKIDVDSTGQPWVVTSSNDVYHYTGSEWVLLPGGGKLLDIGIGDAHDDVWGLGLGGDVWHFSSSSQTWGFLGGPQNSLAIDVDPDGTPWIITSANEIWKCGSSCSRISAGGLGLDIGVGGLSNEFGTDTWPWLIGLGGGIWALNGQGAIPNYAPAENQWVPTNGLAARISVGPHGQPWVVNSAGNIFRRRELASF